MVLGQLIKQYREQRGLSRTELAERLAVYGIELPESTLRYWEKGGRRSATDWNPNFIAALADAFDVDELELLHQLGFPVIPEGFILDDLKLARRLRELPVDKRKEAIRALLTVLDAMGIE